MAPVCLDAAGVLGPTRHQAGGPNWRRVGHGLYVPSSVASTLEQRIVEAAANLPPGGAVTGWAALAWLGAPWFTGVGPGGELLDVPLAIGDKCRVRPRAGIRLVERWFGPDAIWVVDGLPITAPTWSVSHEMLHPHRRYGAEIAVDMAAYSDLVSREEMREHLYADLYGRPGVVAARSAWARSDENSWSPQETVMRLTWIDARPVVDLLSNVPVFDLDGNHLFTPDLLDRSAGVVGEYDGMEHLEDGRRVRDLNREDLVRNQRVEAAIMMSGGQGARDDFLLRLRSAYARSQRHAREGVLRRWTTCQPSWWVDTSTVAARRALTDQQRQTWLAHRFDATHQTQIR